MTCPIHIEENFNLPAGSCSLTFHSIEEMAECILTHAAKAHERVVSGGSARLARLLLHDVCVANTVAVNYPGQLPTEVQEALDGLPVQIPS